MSESMVAKVAQAMREAVESQGERSVSFEEMSFIVARATIKAMRDPPSSFGWKATEAVHRLAHGHEVAFYRFHGVLAPDAARVYSERLIVGFNAIIDAALVEDAE